MRAVRLLVWLAGSALCVGMARAVGPVDQPDLIKHRAIVYFATAFVGLTIGVLVWERRPDSRTGLLLTALPFVEVLSQARWIFWNHALPVTIGFASMSLYAPVFAHLILSYPTGRLTTRLDRVFVAVVYAYATTSALLFLLFFDTRAPHDRYEIECWDCALPLTHVAWRDVHRASHVLDLTLLVVAPAFIGLLIRKLLRATPGGRRIELPLSIAAFAAVAQLLAHFALNGSPDSPWTDTPWFWISIVVSLAVPLSLGVGLFFGRRARSAVADLVVELQRTPPGHVQEALARTLGDPSLELALWLPDQASYVDSRGAKVELPAAGPHRAVTVLGSSDSPVAALLHDPALLERPGLLEAAAAAARLALENERLQAELRAQLSELRASRARIVQAGDDERRRLERNLHDGAQQRLLSLGLALQLARAELGAEANGASSLLVEAEDELRAALDELRELARGIHPAILTDQGLGAAVRSLAERSSVPVRIVSLPGERLDESTEAASYFLVSESLANCAKYAHASTVRVSIARRNGNAVVDIDDNGVGGADATRGSGLRGLSDRVQALDGTFLLESPVGGGTHVHAEIPCAS
ncbi:MAG TPA: histidine kinase [Gaiellaceae bacterium]|nr:histidine kinase [Gaiellaceae bacterium]